MTRISVIVPVYKVEKFIHRCVDSIINQTFTDFELVLVDDGSPDNCGIICDEYALKDNRIHVIHKVNGGLSDARNAGIDWSIKYSDSEWLTFIDSDDWIHPEYLSFLYRAVCDYNTSISICDFKKTQEVLDFTHEHFNAKLETPQNMLIYNRENTVVAWGKLYKKTIFQSSLRFPFGKLHEDEYTTYKALFSYPSISYLDNPLYFYYINPASITQSNWSIRRLDGLNAFQEQMHYFEKNGYKRAYANSARVLYLGYADAIYMLREQYGYALFLRLKYLSRYYFCKLRRFDRFLEATDKVIVKKKIHPMFFKINKWIRKKKSIFSKLRKEENSFE